MTGRAPARRWSSFPVVEQRAPASGCRDHASRLRSSGCLKSAATGGRRPGVQAAGRVAARRWLSFPGGRAASASERVSRPPLAAAGLSSGESAATGRTPPGFRPPAGWRFGGGLASPVVEQRAPASGCRDHNSRLRGCRVVKAQQRADAAGVQAAGRVAVRRWLSFPGGRAASASEPVSRPQLAAAGWSSGESAATGRHAAGFRPPAGWRLGGGWRRRSLREGARRRNPRHTERATFGSP